LEGGEPNGYFLKNDWGIPTAARAGNEHFEAGDSNSGAVSSASGVEQNRFLRKSPPIFQNGKTDKGPTAFYVFFLCRDTGRRFGFLAKHWLRLKVFLANSKQQHPDGRKPVFFPSP